MSVLHVAGYGGGVALEGSSDVQRTDELRRCDSYDIGPRGQLIAASDLSSYVDALSAGATALAPVYAIGIVPIPQSPQLVCVGDAGGNTYVSFIAIDGGTAANGTSEGAAHSAGWSVTMASFPFVSPRTGAQVRLMLVCIAARAAYDPVVGLGLFAAYHSAPNQVRAISRFDSLGTGPDGEVPTGTKGKQLYPRGVMAYNGHALLWGYDSHDGAGDGPNRVMFSNIGNPLKVGVDPADADPALLGTDRDFEDSDAVLIGGAGEVIRAGLVWAEKAWFGTSAGLHYLAGFGRESFLTNGASAVRQSKNVVGPHALIEGPDGLMHGVGDEGHWVFDGSVSDPVGNKLRNFASKSPGYWDLIWTDDAGTLAAFPGRTNQDLVWMVADSELRQVLIGIPFCDATAGYGAGTDTVVIKYHVDSKGYTRQVFAGKTMLSAVEFKREQVAASQRFVAGASLTTNVMRHRYKASGTSSPAMPSVLPDVEMGEYSPHGPDGVGVNRKLWLTVAWEAASALPLVFSMTPTVDGVALPAVKLTIGPTTPSTPSNGDLWVDTSGTDTNLGNGTAGSFIPASAADYILKRYVTTWAKWSYVPGGGQQGTRVTVPLAYDPTRGTRTVYRVQCTAASGRYQLEGAGLDPSTIRSGQ